MHPSWAWVTAVPLVDRILIAPFFAAIYCDFYNSHERAGDAYHYTREDNCTWHYRPCLCPEQLSSVPGINMEGKAGIGSAQDGTSQWKRPGQPQGMTWYAVPTSECCQDVLGGHSQGRN